MLTCLGLLLVFCLSAYGWGWGANRLLPDSPRLSAAYLATLGLSVWVAIGGILNAANIAYPIVLNLILVLGIVLFVISLRRWARDSESGSPGSYGWGEPRQPGSRTSSMLTFAPYLIVIAATAFNSMALLPAGAFNHHDDFYKYLPRIVQMLQTGTLGGNPFSWVGADSLGAQAFLQGFFVSHLPLLYVNCFDAVICFLLGGLLISDLGRRLNIHWLLTSLVVVFFIFFNPQVVNISALYSGVLMILALVYSSILFLEMGTKTTTVDLVRASIPLALFAATLANLKQTFVPFAAIYFCLFFLLAPLSQRSARDVLLSVGTATVTAVLSLSPWIWVFWDKFHNAIEMAEERFLILISAVSSLVQTTMVSTAYAYSANRARADEASLFEDLFSFRPLFWGGNQFYYNFLFFGIAAATIYAYYCLRKESKASRALLLVAATAGTAAISIYLLNVGITRDIDSGIRFSAPILMAVYASLVLIYGNHTLFHTGSPDRTTIRSKTLGILLLALLCVPISMISGQWWERSTKALETRSFLAFPVSPGHMRYQSKILSDQARQVTRSMQEPTEENSTIWAWISTPFHLDFSRNRILYASSSERMTRGTQLDIDDSGNWLQNILKAEGVDYILWEYYGPRKEIGPNGKLTEALGELVKKGQVILNENGRALIKLPN